MVEWIVGECEDLVAVNLSQSMKLKTICTAPYAGDLWAESRENAT
jgi:hypothetical protein